MLKIDPFCKRVTVIFLKIKDFVVPIDPLTGFWQSFFTRNKMSIFYEKDSGFNCYIEVVEFSKSAKYQLKQPNLLVTVFTSSIIKIFTYILQMIEKRDPNSSFVYCKQLRSQVTHKSILYNRVRPVQNVKNEFFHNSCLSNKMNSAK